MSQTLMAGWRREIEVLRQTHIPLGLLQVGVGGTNMASSNEYILNSSACPRHTSTDQ